MESFKDNKRTAWKIDLTYGLIRQIRSIKYDRSDVIVDLLALGDNEFDQLNRLQADPITLLDVLWECVKDQATEKNIEPEDFGRRMKGQPIFDAFIALAKDAASFCPSQKIKASLLKVIDLATKTSDLLADRAATSLENLTPEQLLGDLVAASSTT